MLMGFHESPIRAVPKLHIHVSAHPRCPIIELFGILLDGVHRSVASFYILHHDCGCQGLDALVQGGGTPSSSSGVVTGVGMMGPRCDFGLLLLVSRHIHDVIPHSLLSVVIFGEQTYTRAYNIETAAVGFELLTAQGGAPTLQLYSDELRSTPFVAGKTLEKANNDKTGSLLEGDHTGTLWPSKDEARRLIAVPFRSPSSHMGVIFVGARLYQLSSE
ncbi:hypothetical protein QBC37DRAFT_397775 [Rhypophila decipiens]|uniref:Uncharacterized protein n=1 Tax=Rhypophila decipiens TaxID=261697 RepID=A0AAN6YEH9_9PEZI|nr:hypothetical protein QBC37DRAFT_397775 [Rhypophila decipiens]